MGILDPVTAMLAGMRVMPAASGGLVSSGITRTPLVLTDEGMTAQLQAADPLTLPGGRIAFPAASIASTDPNTLDDYAEGTFTPTLTFGAGSAGITYAAQAGRFTKIGRRVWVDLVVALTSKGTSTGNALVRGLPYTSASGSVSAIGAVIPFPLTGVTSPHCSLDPSASVVNLYQLASGALATITDANFAANTSVYLSISYDT